MRGFSVHTVGGSAVGDAIDKNVKMMFVNFPITEIVRFKRAPPIDRLERTPELNCTIY
jgi:hypothetical protein